MTRAIFIPSGKTPACNEMLNICYRGITRYGINFLTRHINIIMIFEFLAFCVVH